ncbi:MAG: FkbM family methyltransferase [Comamonadaceae bacterium]|nr:MAG: FkbM family methyltransferase [Comamonadaceae bacterium]
MNDALAAEDLLVAVCPNGRRIHLAPGDQRGERLRECHGNLNPWSLKAWQLLVASDWTDIIDVGANYGEMLLNLDIPPSVRCIAVEPNPSLATLLKRSLAEAGLDVRVEEKALGRAEGTLPLLVDDTWSGLSKLGTEHHAESGGHTVRQLEVPVTTLASLIDDGRKLSDKRVLVKVDVEGWECDVLRGLHGLGDQLADLVILLEILHLSQEDIDWLVSRFQPEVFDRITGAFIPIQGNGARLSAVLRTAAFHTQDVVLRRRHVPR